MWLNLPRSNFFVKAVALAAFELILYAIMAPFFLLFAPAAGFIAAGVAAGLCMASAILSLWVHHVFRDPKSASTGILLGMAVNLGIPFGFGIAIHLHGGLLSQAGFLYYLLFFYLLTLAFKTFLALPSQRQTSTSNHFSR